MIATAISITKYENEAASAEKEEKEEEGTDDDDDDNDSVEKAAGAHNTRRGRPYLLAKTQSILRKIRFPDRQGSHFPYLLPTTSPPFVMD